MNKSIKINDRIELINKIKNNLDKYNAKLSDKQIKELKDRFTSSFVICESSYKIILKKYLQDNNKYTSDNNLTLKLKQITSSLSYALFNVDKELLNKLFASTGKFTKVGTRSAKQLRNAMVHSLNTSCIDELIERETELFNNMNKFLDLITK